MNIKLLHITLILSLCAALAACSDQDVWVDDPSTGKTPIELSVGGVDAPALTRAVVTDGTGKTMQNFDDNTNVFMVMKSEYKALTGEYSYLNYGGEQTTKYTVTRGEVVKNSSDITFNSDAQKRYWDDAHARSSQLTIWAYAQKGRSEWNNCTFQVSNSGGTGIDAFKSQEYNTAEARGWTTGEIYPAIRYWRASSHQDDEKQDKQTLSDQDLLFSNNIANNTEYNKGDRRLTFDESNRHFPNKTDVWTDVTPEIKKTEMKFYHAMSKITIKMIAGDGFKKDGTDFKFPSTGGNVSLNGFNKKGLFNIKTGQFEYIWTTKPDHQTEDPTPYYIPEIYMWDTPMNGTNQTLEALVIPNIHEFLASQTTPGSDVHSRFVADESEVMMEFTIDGNTYKITSATLFSALLKGDGTAVDNATKITKVTPNYIPLEAGKNYVFTFTIGKTKINDITAKVAEWETVEANNINPKNGISLTLDMERTTGTQTPLASRLYKSAVNEESTAGNEKGYRNNDYKDLSAVTTQQGTDWYWPSNDTYYHFRTIAPQCELTQDGTSSANYLTMTGGAVASTSDYAWGAPLQEKHQDSGHAIPYNMNNGYEDYLFHAIGPTDNNIHITQFHMMSDLEVNLSTTSNESPDHVDLTSATVALKKYYNTGNLMVGTGLIDGRGSLIESQELPVETGGSKYSWRVIPQHLSRTGTDAGTVGLCITTADGNVYDIPDLSTLKVTINSQANQMIPTWLPGKKYVYNLKLKKSRIENLTATILDWETVEASNDNVQIK